jgi:serine/threonine-protein kinase
MAPEQAAGHSREATTAVDVYSLGAILYELLTGRPPFQAESTGKTLRLVLETDPISPVVHNPSVPPDLATICLKCLEKEPARRYASAELLAEEFTVFVAANPSRGRWPGGVALSRQPVLAGSLARWPASLVLWVPHGME